MLHFLKDKGEEEEEEEEEDDEEEAEEEAYVVYCQLTLAAS